MKSIVINHPKQQRSRQKFHAILDACPGILREFGFKKSTAAKIALEADVSIGTFYDYFSCKEAVFIAYLDRELDNALEQVAENAQQKDTDARSILRALVTAGVEFAHNHRDIIKLVFTHFPDELHQIDLRESKKKIGNIASDFSHNTKITFSGRDPRLITYTLTNIVLGFQFRIVVMPEEKFEKQAVIEELTNIISAYLLQ